MAPQAGDDRVVLAVVTRPHGLRGAVHAKVFNPDTDALGEGTVVRVTLAGTERRVRLIESRSSATTWVLHFEGCTSAEAADALRGAEVWLPRAELPAPAEGEYYFADLVGCVVSDQQGQTLGTVREVISYPSVDALVLDGGREIPWVDGIVITIDVTARAITVDRDALPEE